MLRLLLCHVFPPATLTSIGFVGVVVFVFVNIRPPIRTIRPLIRPTRPQIRLNRPPIRPRKFPNMGTYLYIIDRVLYVVPSTIFEDRPGGPLWGRRALVSAEGWFPSMSQP